MTTARPAAAADDGETWPHGEEHPALLFVVVAVVALPAIRSN
jgi:hypothetical protein